MLSCNTGRVAGRYYSTAQACSAAKQTHVIPWSYAQATVKNIRNNTPTRHPGSSEMEGPVKAAILLPRTSRCL